MKEWALPDPGTRRLALPGTPSRGGWAGRPASSVFARFGVTWEPREFTQGAVVAPAERRAVVIQVIRNAARRR